MKQVQYTREQNIVIDVINIIASRTKFINEKFFSDVVPYILQKYKIPTPFLTLRDYILKYSNGAYHTFHFKLNNREINISYIEDFLTDDLCDLFKLTNEYYVISDSKTDNGGNCENYHCDHYLKLAKKED